MKNLVLLPGTGCDEELWQYQIKHLDDLVKSQVIVFERQSSLEEMVDYVLKNSPEKFSLAGHSLGGWVAQAIAARAPERLENLFLMQTFTKQTSDFWEGMRNWIRRINNGELETILEHELASSVFHKRSLLDIELVNRHRRMTKRFPPEVYILGFQAMLDHPSVFDCLNKIKASTLIIAGRADTACDLVDHHLMHQSIKDAQLVIIEDCGHLCPMEQPQATTALMRLWLTKPD